VTQNELIERYGLEPHPEGGFFKETYRSEHSTAIYFLIPAGKSSRLHRIKSDEVWHFYAGGPMTIVEIAPGGKVLKTTLGPGAFQHVVPAGHWFGGYPHEGSPFSFVGCTVAPAFRFEDFELGAREELLKEFPQARDVIERLT
jgi:uncharacterized protein